MTERNDAFSFEQVQQTFMQRVYQWMAIGLTLTGLVAMWAAGNMALMKAMAGGMGIVLMIGLLVLVFWLSSQALKLSPAVAIAGFLAYAGLNGLFFSFIFLVYTQASIASTFFITAGTFAAVSIYGWVTKSDLSSMGSFLFMGLIGVIIASVVNIFFQSPVLYWIVSYAGLAIFIGLTAYDTQKLKQIHQSGAASSSEQLAILGALTLYLDFINMFLFLLRIFGRRR